MANYQNLKAAISAAIKTNGNQEITGQVLQDVLNSIVSVIGDNYTFAGVATPATNPGTPDQNVVYLASEGGTYTNFNGTVLPAGISLLMWNGTWTSKTVMYGDGGVFDISVYKSSGGTLATFADLSAALDGGNNIPVGARKGGMSVKFVQSSDNNYAQYRLKTTSFSTNTKDWDGISEDLLSSTDSNSILDLICNIHNIELTNRISEFTVGHYINAQGEEVADSNASCTDKIYVNGENTLAAVTCAIALTRIVFYNAQNQVISASGVNSKPFINKPQYLLSIPDNTSYIRVSNYIKETPSVNTRGLLKPVVGIGSIPFVLEYANIRDIEEGGTGLYKDIVPAANKVIRISTSNGLNSAGEGVAEAVIIGDGTTACKNLPIHILEGDDSEFHAKFNNCIKAAELSDFNLYNKVIMNDGREMTFDNCVATDYIEIPSDYNMIYLGVSLFAAASVCIYDSNHEKITNYSYSKTWQNLNPNAKYFRACNLLVTNQYAQGFQKPLILLAKSDSYSLPIKNKFSELQASIQELLNTTETRKDLSQRIVEIYASQKKYYMLQRIDSDVFVKGGYINANGEIVLMPDNNEFIYTPEKIAVSSIYVNKMCMYINSVASVKIVFFNGDNVLSAINNWSRNIVGVSNFEFDVPSGTTHIMLSCVTIGYSVETNNNYAIKYPYIILCENAVGLSNTEQIDNIKSRFKNKEISFSGEQEGYYKSDGTVEDVSSSGMFYIPKVDVELYNRLYIQTTSYAQGNVVVEFDQSMNVLHHHRNGITDITNLLSGRVIELDSRTRFIGLSNIGRFTKEQHYAYSYQDNTYYSYLAKKAILYRDNEAEKEYSDSPVNNLMITKDDFTDSGHYVKSDGIRDAFGNAKLTGFIDIRGFDSINIKRLSSVALLSIAFYTSASEEDFLYSLTSGQISTSNGERTYELRENANYVRISWLYNNITVSGIIYYVVDPFVKFFNKEVVEEVVVKSPIVYDKSFFGDKNFALFDDFDYSQILCYGQSFADGGSSSPGGSTEVVPNAYMLGNNTRDTSGALNQLAVNGVREFPVIGCVNALAKICNRTKPHKFIASTGGGNGRCIAAMSEGTSFFNDMVTMFGNIKNVVDAENKTVGLAAIFFLQGESDYTPNSVDAEIYTNDKDEYKRRLLKLKNDLQDLAVTTYGQSYRPLFFVYQTSGSWIRSDSYTGSDNRTCPISMAQFELAQEYDDVILISPCYFMSLYDNNHPSINGYRWTGEMAAKAIIQSLNMGIRYSNTKIEKVSYVKNKVFVDCYCPVLPLQVRTLETAANTNYGFWIREDGVEVTINDITINGSQILLTLAKELDANKTHEISYAGRYRGGRGNICDSDKWISTLNYIDDTNDHTIVQRPKNPDGTNIFGQKYPMFNYLGVYYEEF